MNTKNLSNSSKILTAYGRTPRFYLGKDQFFPIFSFGTHSPIHPLTHSLFIGLVVLLTLSSLSATFAELIPITLEHDGNVNSVAFSPDGKLLATGSADKTAKVWGMPSGEPIATLKHDASVYSVAFSQDGKLLATGSTDIAKVWEIPSGKLIATMNRGGGGWSISSVAFSQDGKLLATGWGGSASVWEIPSGERIATMSGGGWTGCSNCPYASASISPDWNLVATASNELNYQLYKTYVWEMPSGKQIATLRHDLPVYSVTFSPDGKLLATGSYDVRFWEMPFGNPKGSLNVGVSSIAFSPDGKLLATGSYKSFDVRVWEMPYQKLIATLQSVNVWSVSFSPDGRLLATGSKVWEMPSGKLIATLDGSPVTFSPDGRLLATGSGSEAKVWAPNIADIPPLTQPPDGSKFVDALPELKWGKVSNVLLYQVQVSKDKNFSRVLLEASTSAESLKIDTGQIAQGTYFWRVRTVGWNSLRDFGKWSEVWTFSLTGPPAPALSSPADGTAFADTLTPTLKWQASEKATSYGVQVAKDEKFAEIVLEQTKITATEYAVPTGKLSPGKYFWRVNATGVTVTGDWSKPLSFTVDAVNIVSASVISVTMTDYDYETKGVANIIADIKIDKAQNLYGFQIDLKFDPNVLEAIKVTEGDFLKSIGGNTTFLKPSIDNRSGIIKSVASTRITPGEASGAGALAKVEFKFKRAGTSPITFTLVKLSNEQFQPIPYAYVDGSATFTITATPKPVASAKFKVALSIVDNQVVAKVLIENAVQLCGYSVDFEYPSALELLNVKQGEFLKENWKQTTLFNTVRFTASKPKKEFVEGSGEIATLTYRIWEGGELPFTLKGGDLTAPTILPSETIGKSSNATLEGGKITVVASPNWEVNKDYVVDVQDIVILGINFDKKITGNPRPNPDVTRDGLVDIYDLTAVGAHYADEYSAVPKPPAAPVFVRKGVSPYSLKAPTATQKIILQNLYEKIKDYPDTDASVMAVKRLLAILLKEGQALPKETRLAQNYPNPFNPETWIPFELSQDADVTVTIYDATGRLIRALSLGRKPAGYYLSKERAAYWDGRNASGERVASGVYFYTFTAGTFSATKKFIMLK